jgi:hydroxymethylpyrimidine pyrophosphatase-like HAD family hydrolase
MIYPPQRTIAVDVDKTLYHGGAANEPLIRWLRARKAEGFHLILWSARGQQHALEIANRLELVALFDTIVSKPGYVVDNEGWAWTRFTRIVFDFINPPT